MLVAWGIKILKYYQNLQRQAIIDVMIGFSALIEAKEKSRRLI